jgi:YHS domain-containing protein
MEVYSSPEPQSCRQPAVGRIRHQLKLSGIIPPRLASNKRGDPLTTELLTMKPIVKVFLFVCLAVNVSLVLAAPEPNVDKNGVGIQGYDPVAFFTDGKPVLGKEEFHVTYRGVIYRFASAEHQATFEKAPAKYEPQFGGYCAYGVAQGHLAPGKVEAFQIVNGQLLMQYDSRTRDEFNKNQQANLHAAQSKWQTLPDTDK